MKKTKLFPLFLALGLVLSSCSSEDSNENNNASSSDSNESSSLFGNILGGDDNATVADEMRLENYTGSITLQNNSEEKAVVLGSRLVTGDNIETMTESNAYVVLDSSKVLRVNETSQVEIIQEDKHLDIHLSKGTVFFNVTSTLSEEETLKFHTNNVVTGVRGTSGIIHFDSVAQVTQIVVLTGVVTGTTVNEEQNIEAGQVAIVETLPDGTVEMTIYELEEEDPVYLFSNTFIDGLQSDLNFLDGSVPLSDLMRLPDMSQYEGIYQEVLQDYRDYLFQNATPVSSNNYGLYWMHMAWEMDRRYSREDLKVGYELVDLDGNGVPELFIYHSKVFDFEDVSVLREIYTIENGAPKMIDQADTQFLLVAYDNAVIEFAGEFYRLEGTEKVPVSAEDRSEKLPIGTLTMVTAEVAQNDTEEPVVPDLSGTVSLPENINVIGNNRTMTAQQAQGFAQALGNMERSISHVAFVDNGEDGLAIITGYYDTSTLAMAFGYLPFDPIVILWNGSAVEISPPHQLRYETWYKLYEENGRYYIGTVGDWGSDGGDTGAGTFDVEYRYFLESGIFGDTSPYNYFTADGTLETREFLNNIYDYTLAESAVATAQGHYAGQDLSYLYDAIEAQGMTVETYLLRNGTIQLLSELPPSNFVMKLDDGQDEPYWNSLEDVLAVLAP